MFVVVAAISRAPARRTIVGMSPRSNERSSRRWVRNSCGAVIAFFPSRTLCSARLQAGMCLILRCRPEGRRYNSAPNPRCHKGSEDAGYDGRDASHELGANPGSASLMLREAHFDVGTVFEGYGVDEAHLPLLERDDKRLRAD